MASAAMEQSVSTAATQSKTKLIWRVVILLVVLAAIGGSVRYWLGTMNTISTDDAQVDGRIVNVAPKVSGYISELLVGDNQLVRKGQVIARIDAREYAIRVRLAEAQVAVAGDQARSSQLNVPLTAATTSSSVLTAEANQLAAEADFERAKAGLEQARQAEISFARANIENKKATQDRAHADLERMKILVAKEEISKQQYDSFVAAARIADSDVAAAQDRLQSAEKSADIANASLSAARARVEQAKAQVTQARANQGQVGIRSSDTNALQASRDVAMANLDAAKLQLADTEIVAAQDGYVTRRTVEVGQYVNPGQTLLTIIPRDDIWVTANFKETELKQLKPGQKVDLKVDMLGATVHGEVESIAGATGSRLSLLPPENATGNFVKVVQRIPVKIKLDPEVLQSHRLGVGANVVATVHTN